MSICCCFIIAWCTRCVWAKNASARKSRKCHWIPRKEFRRVNIMSRNLDSRSTLWDTSCCPWSENTYSCTKLSRTAALYTSASTRPDRCWKSKCHLLLFFYFYSKTFPERRRKRCGVLRAALLARAAAADDELAALRGGGRPVRVDAEHATTRLRRGVRRPPPSNLSGAESQKPKADVQHLIRNKNLLNCM